MPNKRTLAKIAEVSAGVAEAKRQNVPRAIKTLSDLMVTATGYAAKYQRLLVAWEALPGNGDKAPPPDIAEHFWLGFNAARKAAEALAPYQDPKFSNIKVSHSPFDAPVLGESPKTIEGKDLKIDLTDPIEVARIYTSLIRAA